MKAEEIVRLVFEACDRVGIPYVLVGSFASNLYGIPRSTKDVDFVLQSAPGQFSQLMTALGPNFVRDPQVQFETVTGTKKIVVEETESGFEIEFFELSSEPHDQERFARRRRIAVLGRDAWVLTPEDVLVTNSIGCIVQVEKRTCPTLRTSFPCKATRSTGPTSSAGATSTARARSWRKSAMTCAASNLPAGMLQ